MPNQPKDTDTEEIEWKHALAERLKELIVETGGDAKFLKKLKRIQLKGSTTATVLNGWRDTGKGISLKKIYLIAMACNVSVDWLLGLSMEKSRSKGIFKYPATYGDALSILNNLIKMKVIEIANSDHWFLPFDIYIENGVTKPRYIQIKDAHLIDLIKDLYRSQELSERQFTDAWERMLKLEINKPIQDIQAHDDNPDHNGVESGQATGKETAVSAKVLDDNALKNQVAEQLRKLQNDLSDKEFGDTIGAPKSTVNGWFHPPLHLPEPYTLYKIAKKYNIHADWILGLEEADCMTLPWGDEMYTYGSVLSMLKDLIDKGTINFVEYPDYSYDSYDTDDCEDNKNVLVIDDILIIGDKFLYCLLLKQYILERYSSDVYKDMFEELYNKYKDFPLLSFKKDMRYSPYTTIEHDSEKILRSVWDGKVEHDIDFDKLYKDLRDYVIQPCSIHPKLQ